MAQAAPSALSAAMFDPSRRAGPQATEKPAVRALFEGFAAAVTAVFARACRGGIAVSAEAVNAGRIKELGELCGADLLTAVLGAGGWAAPCVAGFDNRFVFAVLEALFGGDGSGAPFAAARPLTRIETGVAQWIWQGATAALAEAASPVGRFAISAQRADSEAAFAALGRAEDPVVVAKLALAVPGAAGAGGAMFLAVPHILLAQWLPKLEQAAARPAPAADPEWARRFERQIARSDIQVRALLGSRQLTLGDIAALRPGQIVELGPDSGRRVRVECNGQGLFWCQLGQADGVFTLRIDGFVDHEQEFMDDILSH